MSLSWRHLSPPSTPRVASLAETNGYVFGGNFREDFRVLPPQGPGPGNSAEVDPSRDAASLLLDPPVFVRINGDQRDKRPPGAAV